MDLPLTHLESLQFKLTQILESISTLGQTIEHGGQMAMASWPEILVKYNALLSQTHTLSLTLSGALMSQPSSQKPRSGTSSQPQITNPFQRLALHPSVPMTDSQALAIGTLLRVQPSDDVLLAEEATVGRFSETRSKHEGLIAPELDAEMEKEMEKLREEHDARIANALTAVHMLRDKYDWKIRLSFTPPPPKPDPIPTSVPASAPEVSASEVPMETANEEMVEENPPATEPQVVLELEDSDDEDMDDVLGDAADSTPGA